MAASASRIAPDTHEDQASARVRPVPWRHGRPRRTLVPSRIQKSFTEPWLCANALVATMLLVLAFLRSWKRLASGQKRLAKFAASTNAQARYLLPFLTLPSPFFLRLLVCTLSTQRA